MRLMMFGSIVSLIGACGSDDKAATPVESAATVAATPSSEAPSSSAVATTASAAATTAASVTDTTGSPASTDPPVDLEGELVVLCTVAEEWCQATVDAFGDETGVDTQYVRLSAGEAIARLEAEAGDPTFDVWFGGPSVGPATAAGRGVIENYVSPNAADIRAEWQSGDGQWTGIYLGALGFCSNAELLAELGVEAPTSWEDLLDPAFDDNIAMADQRTSGTAATAAAALVAVYGSEDAALDYLKKLDGNIFQYTKSGASPGNMAAQGEVATSVIFSHDCVKFKIETGVDLVVSFPDEGTGFEVGQVSLLADAKHPNAAKAFVDWSLTPAAQEVGQQVLSFQIPTHPDAAVPEEAVRLEDVVLAEGYSTQLAEDLRAGDFPDRFANEVRGGQEAPED